MTCGLCHPATVGVVKIIKGRLNLTLESEVNGFISNSNMNSIIIIQDRLYISVAKRCPGKPFHLERHTNNPSHGDVCRHGQNRNYVCPNGCFKSTRFPFCRTSKQNKNPCRVSEGILKYVLSMNSFVRYFENLDIMH